MTPKVEPPKDSPINGWVTYLYYCDNPVEADAKAVIDQYTSEIHRYIKLQQEALLAKLEAELPLATSTQEELDEANSHLDSRSRAYWDAYNRGYCSLSDQTRTTIDKLRLEL